MAKKVKIFCFIVILFATCTHLTNGAPTDPLYLEHGMFCGTEDDAIKKAMSRIDCKATEVILQTVQNLVDEIPETISGQIWRGDQLKFRHMRSHFKKHGGKEEYLKHIKLQIGKLNGCPVTNEATKQIIVVFGPNDEPGIYGNS